MALAKQSACKRHLSFKFYSQVGRRLRTRSLGKQNVGWANFCCIHALFSLVKGHKELAASALGSMVSSVTAFSITYGASSALDTLCSQAWTGARDKTLLGIYLQRAILILGVIYIPITILWLNATPLLRFLKQDPEIASYAGTRQEKGNTNIVVSVLTVFFGRALLALPRIGSSGL